MIINLFFFKNKISLFKKILFFLLINFILDHEISYCKIIDKKNYFIDTSFKAISQNERIKFIIIHYTALKDIDSLKILTEGRVSTHYLIPIDLKFKKGKPIILQLVDENKRAWHAGISNWHGKSNLNDISLGIEIVYFGTRKNILHNNYNLYTNNQIKTLSILIKDIIKRYKILPKNILGHSDVTVRKQDPGKFFPWEKLARMGIGAWPDKKTIQKYLLRRRPSLPTNVFFIQKALKKYGYDQIPQNGLLDEKTKNIISSFQMHFRQNNIDGIPDAETEAIIMSLIEKYDK